MSEHQYYRERDGAWSDPIPDPEDAGAIAVARSGVCELTTGASGETRTLADPVSIGQIIIIALRTDGGGDAVITLATAFNAGGDVTITLGDAGDFVALTAIRSGDSLIWRLSASSGVPDFAAVDVGIADAGSLVTATEVEAAIQEAFRHIKSAQKFLNIPLGSWQEADGTALADFGGDSTTPGFNAGDESFGIRWHNQGNPDPISTAIPYPPDLDPAANVIIHILAAKVGATVGDAVTWTIEAFENINGALYDADADFGGASSAMTGDATSKTCQEETLVLALANITGAPGTLTLTLQPTDGTLGTDDVILLGVWLEYTGKTLTS